MAANFPIELTVHGLVPSRRLDVAIRERCASLGSRLEHIDNVGVFVEEQHTARARGRVFHVRLDVFIEHHELVVGRVVLDRDEMCDPTVPICDALDAVLRRVEHCAPHCLAHSPIGESSHVENGTWS